MSLVDRALIGEDRRVVAAERTGEDLFSPAGFARNLGDLGVLALSSGPVPDKPRKAVVTLAIGEKYQEMAAVSCPSMRHYAAAIGADFVMIDSVKLAASSVMFEKWQMYDLLFRYDRIVYFDGDILVSPDCPDLTVIAPRDQVGGFVEDAVEDRSSWMRASQELYGDVGWRKGYLNAGMGVYSWLHRPLFENSGCLDFGDGDQCLYNYRVRSNAFSVFSLPNIFNRMDLCGDDRHGSLVLHYAGKGYPGVNDPKTRLAAKVELMRQDAAVIVNGSVNASRPADDRAPVFLPRFPRIGEGGDALVAARASYQGLGRFSVDDHGRRRPLRDYALLPLMIGDDCPIGDEIMMLPVAREAGMRLYLPRTFAGDLVASLVEDVECVRDLLPDTLVCPVFSILLENADITLGVDNWGTPGLVSRYGGLNATGCVATALGLALREPAPRLRRPAEPTPRRVILFPKGNSPRRSLCPDFVAGLEACLKRAGYEALSGDRRFDSPTLFAEFVASAEYVVAPFTGPMHLAAAMGVKTVALCVGDSPGAYRPLQGNVRVLESDCQRCWLENKRGVERPCGELYSLCQRVHPPRTVLAAMESL